MSGPITPTINPFIRGTTNSVQTYFLSAGTRRLIPDASTLSLLLAGQSVRVLSDSDLGAIPLGAPLPTRADGALYQGPGKPFAYRIQGGLKLAYPDATTLSEAGYDFHALLPITAADLSSIPDGTAIASTSRFLSPPSAQVPLVLLPVRLETRFQFQDASGLWELWLRVYPDDVHVNSFEPSLTADEQAARASFLALNKADIETQRSAFGALAGQFGPERAAWLTSAAAATHTQSAQPLAAYTNTLPERWIVVGYQENAAGQILATGPTIANSLAVAPVLGGSGPVTDPATQWLTDFNVAIQAGMAFRITLGGDTPVGFSRIVVLGLRSTLAPSDSAARLGDLFQAHHYTDGLEFLSLGTPTNNTEDVSSALSPSDPDYAQLFALEQGTPLCPARPTADGDRLAGALDISPATFAHVKGADGSQDEQARAMNTVLWPGTWGYYLSQIVTGAVPNPQTILPVARDHYIDHVRARGHYPSLRIGRQPYGLLPVCWSGGWKSLEGRPLDEPLHGLLAQLRAVWVKSIAHVPRMPNAQDPDAELVDILSMTASTASTVARGVVGPEYAFAYWSFIGKDLPASWWTTLAQSALIDGSALAATMAKTRLASSTYLKEHLPLSDILVAPEPLDPAQAPAFIAQINTLSVTGWQALANAAWPLPNATTPGPLPILFLLLQYAAMREYMDTALDLLATANAIQASERIEPEMVNFAGAVLRPGAWDLLKTHLTTPAGDRGEVGVFLDNAKNDPTLPAFAAYWKAFAQLAQWSAADLDAATRESLDLASYRLDSWITSLAHFRLEQTRAANPSGGIVLGGYGLLENVRPQPSSSTAASQGYIHAPSLKQSTTAAVLRSGYLSHLGGAQKPFEIDLSSARVRLALHLMDGVREGQSLGALLGYRMERALQESIDHLELEPLISKLRAAFPMQSATSLDVVDGLALLRALPNPDPNLTQRIPFWILKLGILLTGPQQTGLNAAVAMLVDAVDSLADLTLSESVHQLTQGNVLRAGATLDSIARGDTPPVEIDFINTPRSGTALTFRLMTAACGDSAPGWTLTPRAHAEPRLNAWAATLLGDPSLIRIRTRFVWSDGASQSSVEIGLDKLALAPVDLLSFPETQAISGELADRIRRAAAQVRPTFVPATAEIDILPDRDPAWKPQTIGMTEWLGLLQAVTRMVGGARALEPADLVAQDGTPGAINAGELQLRADAAENALRATLSNLQNATVLDVALLSAAAFGVIGAVPALDPSSWPAQAAAALADLSTRTKLLDQLALGFVRTPDSSDHDLARLQAVFGSSFLILPVLDAAITTSWPQLWGNSATLQGGDTLASVRWMQRASRVRPGAARMDKALMYAEALAGRPLLQFQVAQLPVTANDKWVGLDVPGTSPGSRLSLAMFSPTPFVTGAAVAGLMIDEWIEVWPSTDQITGVSLQYSDPVARAPQTILLAVQPDDFPEWTLTSVEQSILEALELAKIRGVDPDLAFGTIPPLPVDANVKSFQAISDTEMFVLGTDGNLWLEHAPFGTVPPARDHVDANVSSFHALSDTWVLVQGTDNRLWLEQAPFGIVPPKRQQVDAGQPTLPIPAPPPATTKVPDLSDETPKSAMTLLQAHGLVASFQGVLQGDVVMSSQSPAANQVVLVGSTVTVHWLKDASSKK